MVVILCDEEHNFIEITLTNSCNDEIIKYNQCSQCGLTKPM